MNVKEVEQLKELLTQSTIIIAEMEQNKEAIKILGAYTTIAIDGLSTFLQGNVESVLTMFVSSLTNTWGKGLIQRCGYLGEARKELIKAGFTPDEAYAILETKQEELKDTLNNISKAMRKYRDDQNEETPEEN